MSKSHTLQLTQKGILLVICLFFWAVVQLCIQCSKAKGLRLSTVDQIFSNTNYSYKRFLE
jgi:hypothetical protein